MYISRFETQTFLEQNTLARTVKLSELRYSLTIMFLITGKAMEIFKDRSQ